MKTKFDSLINRLQQIDLVYIEYFFTIIITYAIAFVLTIVFRKTFNKIVQKDSKKLKIDPTNYSFLKNSLTFIIFLGATIIIFYKIPFLKSLGAAIFAGAGVLAAIIGFASQKAFSNIISGVFILMFKPFKVGDILQLSENQRGVLEEITLRHVIIRDFENERIIIPNSNISEITVKNSNISDERIRKHVEFGISYDSDINTAITIIQEEAKKHPLFIDGRTNQEKKIDFPKVLVKVVELADFSVKLRAYVWAKNYEDGFFLKCDLLKSVKERFDEKGVEIPFPYRTIVYKKDLIKLKNEKTQE